MKKLTTCLLCVVFVCSSLWMGASLFAKDIMQHSLVSIAVEEIHLEKKINAFLHTLPIPGKELFATELNAVAKTIANNPKVNEEVNKYLNNVMDDIIYDKETVYTSHLNENIKVEIVGYAPHLSALTNHLIAKDDIATVLTIALESVDFQAIYDTEIEAVKKQLSTNEKLAIRVVRFLETEQSFYLSMAIAIACAVAILILNIHLLKGLIYLGVSSGFTALLLYTCQYLIPYMFNMYVSKGTPNQDLINSASYFGKTAVYFLLIGVVSVVLKIGYQAMIKKK